MDIAAVKRRYVVDTCSFLTLQELYPEDVFPSIWARIDELIGDGQILSVEDVFLEISTKEDQMHAWAQQRHGIFVPLQSDVQQVAIQVLARHPTLVDVKRNKSSADPFVIAAAVVNGAAVVTEEKFSGGPERAKIPDVCESFGIVCINLLSMLRAEGVRL